MSSDARVGYRRTGNASRSFLCLAASVGSGLPPWQPVEKAVGQLKRSGSMLMLTPTAPV
jgi:hypothetical protein